MRILFIADVPLANPTSGSEQVLHQQATALARQGEEVFAITRQEGPPSSVFRDVEGVSEGCYSAEKENYFGFLLSVMRNPPKLFVHLKKGGPFDVAIFHQPFTCLPILIGGSLRTTPSIYNFHSPSHEEYLLLHQKRGMARRYLHVNGRWFIEWLCVRKAARVMVESQYMKTKVEEIHGIPGKRIVVNPGGVDLVHFSPPQDRGQLKKKLNLPENRIHLLTVRNLEPRMGLDNLLKCIYILKTRQAGIHLVLGGEGPEKKNLENLIGEYDLDDAVMMTGFIPPDLLPKYYGAADFFILPTRQLEGFGLVTVESMACGTPVLGTPVGGTKEILSAFDPQFLFKDNSPEAMADGIEAAISENLINKKKYDELRVRCREYAERNYSWKRHVEQLRSIVDEIIRH